jgi:hypothetical protein
MGGAPYPFPDEISIRYNRTVNWGIKSPTPYFNHTSSCPIHEAGLRLKVTVKPVVGDHSPSNNYQRPRKDGDHTRHPSGTGWHRI